MFSDNGATPISFADYFEEIYTGLDDKEEDIVNQAIEVYGSLSGSALIKLTHGVGTPWEKCFDGSVNKIIPNSMIKDYFKKESEKDSHPE